MSIVLGTNVVVSAAFKRQSMPGMAALILERRGVLLKLPATEAQLFEVVARPYFDELINASAQAWLHALMAAAEPLSSSGSSPVAIRPMTSFSNWR
jgi:hypothetical protein